jgi:hypothetical protein
VSGDLRNLEARFPAQVAALRPALEELEAQGWSFHAGRPAARFGVVSAHRRDGRGSLAVYGPSVRELVERIRGLTSGRAT